MTALSKTALKALFETGDTITQTTMANLIDSFLDLVESSAQTITGPIIFSGAVTFNGGTPIPVSAGGTGVVDLSAYAILVGSNTSAVSLISPSSTIGIPLISQGVSANPAYSTALVPGGGTGITSVSAYSILCGGITNTEVLQNVSGTGTSGQVLTSNGVSALPTWQNAQSGILSSVYPVGSVYINYSDNTNPATLFGFGTWVALQNSFLIGAGGTYAAGATGGATTHTLTVSEIPALTYSTTFGNTGGSFSPPFAIGKGNPSDTPVTQDPSLSTNAGGGSHSILNPYIAVYMWRRTV